MTEDRSGRVRRARRQDPAAELLRTLRERRDHEDAPAVARREREDAALAAYAAAEVETVGIAGRVAERVAALEEQIGQARRDGEAELVDVEARKAAALLELAEVDRSAEQIAKMVGLSPKKVRAMVRAARPASAQGPTAAAVEAVRGVQVAEQSRAADTPAPDESSAVDAQETVTTA
ncbi:MAG: hypothetical protein ABIQ18_48860 [Umezawaea sp.]